MAAERRGASVFAARAIAPSLKSNVVVVTGASGGIGRAAAVAFGRAGATVALLARGEQGLAAAAREVEAAGGRAMAVLVDVVDANAMFAAAERIEAECGEIGIWVNNAMATIISPVDQISPVEFKRVNEVTYLGGVHGTMAALRHMKPRGRGTIVQVGSALAYRGIPLQAPYCGAKHALRGFTDSLRCELIHDKSPLHITMVHLAGFNTPQFDWARNRFSKRPQPVPPIFQPEIAARAIVWAAQHRRREVWVGFPTLQTIVGNRLAPGLMDWIMAKKAYEGQLTEEEEPHDRPDNLFAPVPGDFGTHGRFDDRARTRSWQLIASIYRWWFLACAAAVALIAIAIGATVHAAGERPTLFGSAELGCGTSASAGRVLSPQEAQRGTG